MKESELFSKSTSRHVFTLAGRRFILTARAEAPPPIEWDRKTQGPQPWRPHVLTARVDLLPQGVSERSALPGMEKTHEERAKQRLQLQALDTPRGSESGASQGTPTKLFRKRSKTTVCGPRDALALHGGHAATATGQPRLAPPPAAAGGSVPRLCHRTPRSR